VYDPVTATWSFAGELAQTRGNHTATLLADGRVLVVGGEMASGRSSAEVYDPATNAWTSTGPIPTGMYLSFATATLLTDGKVLVAGGGSVTDWVLDTTFVYDPATNTWMEGGKLDSVRLGHTATALPDGDLVFAGGFDYDDVQFSSEVYAPGESRSLAMFALVDRRAFHTATMLADGSVLLTGGRDLDHILQSTELLVRTVRARFAPTGPLSCADSVQGLYHWGSSPPTPSCRSGVP